MCRSVFRDLGYIVKKPQGQAEKYPAILFLHGAGTRGTDLNSLEANPFFAADSCINAADFPFLVFAPQCPADSWFDVFEQLEAFVKMIAAHPLVDAKRICLMGTSMGGYAAWQLAMSLPSYFAAAAVLCGGGMYWNAYRLQHLPVWAFHGEEDTVVYPEESVKMVEAINKQGGNAKLTLFEHTGHDCWTQVYRDQKVFAWLLQQTKKVAGITEQKLYSNSKQYG